MSKKVEQYISNDGKLILKVDIADIMADNSKILDYETSSNGKLYYPIANIGSKFAGEKIEGTPLCVSFSLYAQKDEAAKLKQKKIEFELLQARQILSLLDSDAELRELLKKKLGK